MQTRIEDFSALDAVVLAISADGVERNVEIARRYAPDLRVLSDPQLVAIDAFGLRHVDGGIDGDIARPATYIVASDGRVAWRDLTENWRVRPRPTRLLEEIPRGHD